MSFHELGLRAELLCALDAQGYSTPTPIQAQAIPVVLAGHDLLAGAQTGTGKTAAFALPILQKLSAGIPPATEAQLSTEALPNGKTRPGNGSRTNGSSQASSGGRAGYGPRRVPRALILTPTRELAVQVAESFRIYGGKLPLRSTVVYGGVGFEPQAEALRRGVDILVATPGRLLDHAGQHTVDLSQVEILVLDEGDRMLDMGFIHDIRRILNLLPKQRQSMLFSATYSDDIRSLADGMLYKPQSIEVARRNSPAELVTHIVHHVPQADKRAALSQLFRNGVWNRALVFTRTKHGANRLARQLESDGVSATAIHGNKSQAARMRALADFESGKVCALVATDVASRGLDIEELPHVINFELPNVPEDYIHRIGRTGRAGANGTALSLVSAEERQNLRDIQRLLKRDIQVEPIPGFTVEPLAVSAPPAYDFEQKPSRERKANGAPDSAFNRWNRRTRRRP